MFIENLQHFQHEIDEQSKIIKNQFCFELELIIRKSFDQGPFCTQHDMSIPEPLRHYHSLDFVKH